MSISAIQSFRISLTNLSPIFSIYLIFSLISPFICNEHLPILSLGSVITFRMPNLVCCISYGHWDSVSWFGVGSWLCLLLNWRCW